MGEGAVGCRGEPVDDRLKQARLGGDDAVALGDAPGIEGVQLGELEPLEKVAGVSARGRLEALDGRGRQVPVGQRAELRHVDGDAIVVDAPGRPLHIAPSSGSLERGGVRRLRPVDPFRTASVTKAVTAALAVRLASRGAWHLGAPITSYLPAPVAASVRDLEGLSDPTALTVRRLLWHRSGLRDSFFDESFQARYETYRLSLGVNLADGEAIFGATGVWGAFAYFCPSLDAIIAGTTSFCGSDRSALLDSVVVALRAG